MKAKTMKKIAMGSLTLAFLLSSSVFAGGHEIKEGKERNVDERIINRGKEIGNGGRPGEKHPETGQPIGKE